MTKKTTAIATLDEITEELSIFPKAGEDITAFGDRVAKAYFDGFNEHVEQFKQDYAKAVAVLDNPDSLEYVKDGVKLATKLRNKIVSVGTAQRRPFNDVATSHKVKEKELVEMIAPVEEHLKAENTKVQRLEAERIQRMIAERVARLTNAGWERKGSFFMAGPAVIQGSDLETLTNTQFTDKLNEGIDHLQAIARAKAEQQKRESEAELLRKANEDKDREIIALRQQLAALQQPKAEETEPEPAPPAIEPPAPAAPPSFPNRRQVVVPPAATHAPVKPELAKPEPAPFPNGGANETVIDQRYVNGFFKCREEAVEVIMARSEEDGAYLYLKRSDMVEAIKLLMPQGHE